MENQIIEQFKAFLSTPPLWDGMGPFGMHQFSFPKKLGSIPEEKDILNVIPSLAGCVVLGKRMESFFSYSIRTSTEYNLILENIQVARNKITIGEIDFILGDENDGSILHVELVYKFYVYDPSFEIEEERWIGPNRRDSLLRKIKKLKEHQFPLLYKEETKRTLATFKIDYQAIDQKVCFKANLFVPREMFEKVFTLINNSCIVGYWIHIHQFEPGEFSGNLFFIPQKSDWPIDPLSNTDWFPFSGIYEKVITFHNKHFSPLVWMKTPTGEIERFFIVWW